MDLRRRTDAKELFDASFRRARKLARLAAFDQFRQCRHRVRRSLTGEQQPSRQDPYLAAEVVPEAFEQVRFRRLAEVHVAEQQVLTAVEGAPERPAVQGQGAQRDVDHQERKAIHLRTITVLGRTSVGAFRPRRAVRMLIVRVAALPRRSAR